MLKRSIFLAALFLSVLARPAESSSSFDNIIPGLKDSHSLFVTAGPGIAVFGGNTGWSFNLGGVTQAGDLKWLFWGADLGIDFWSFSTNNNNGLTVSDHATGYQLLPTVLFRFDFEALEVFPYFGISAGPHIYAEKIQIAQGQQTQSTGGTTAYFEYLFRPGFFAPISPSVGLDLEAKFGRMGSAWMLLPQVNAVFSL